MYIVQGANGGAWAQFGGALHLVLWDCFLYLRTFLLFSAEDT
jgi:hypothetical protein